MIGVKMTQTDEIEIDEARAGLTEAQKCAAPGVDQNTRLAVNPDDESA